MASQQPTEDKLIRVAEMLDQGHCYDDIATTLQVSNAVISRVKKNRTPHATKSGSGISQSDEVSGNNRTISIPNTRIDSPEKLVAHCKIDLKIWEVERFICNKWEVGAKDSSSKIVVSPLFQVKAFLKKRVEVASAIAEIEALKKEALKYSPRFTGYKPRKPNATDIAVEISVVDHHFGGLIWGQEASGDDWDTKIAMDCWKDAGSTLMARTDSFKPTKAVLLFGNDQQNADNRAGFTEKLTPQQMDGRYQKVFEANKIASRWMVDQAVHRYGSVHVVIAPGNHDPLAAWHLGDHLATWYRNLPCVTVDNGPKHRKFWEWGTVMVMFEHGDKGKLVNYGKVMASEMPQMWGRTQVHEAHTGHVHHERVIEDMGFTGRSLPSLRPACSWGSENHHFGAIRAAQAFAWSKKEGLVGQAVYSVMRNR